MSATQWVILDRKKGNLLFGKCETESKQVASLTKIMTAHCVLNLVESLKNEHNSPYCDLNCQVKILKPVSQMEGTSACLKEGDSLSIMHLMYGMMLPSGNDAAQALATYFGQLILNNGLADPNEAMEVCPTAIERKFKELKIQMAFEHNKNKIIKRRAAVKAEKARL